MEAREGFTVGEKKTMLLSAETAAGLKLTGITFCISIKSCIFRCTYFTRMVYLHMLHVCVHSVTQ